MSLLVAIIVVAALLVGFLFLTRLEQSRGVRVLSRGRETLDRMAGSLFSLAISGRERNSLFRVIGALFEQALHDTVHKVLLGVRILERALTKAARQLRGRKAAKATEEAEEAGSLG